MHRNDMPVLSVSHILHESFTLCIFHSMNNKDTPYNYNNDKIASLSYFTDMDYAQSYCCYNDSKRLERKREANRRAKDKQFKEARQKRKAKRDNICTFIKENPTMPTKDIAIIFDVSTRTIQRIKKELRKE